MASKRLIPHVLVADLQDLPETMTVYIRKHNGNYIGVYLVEEDDGFVVNNNLSPGVTTHATSVHGVYV